MSVIEFWTDHKIDIDFDKLRQDSIPVKGRSYHNPCRGLEIFGNLDDSAADSNLGLTLDLLGFSVQPSCFSFTSGFKVPFGEGIYQPPFVWKDCSPNALAVNFTYMTNAFYRILSGLADQSLLPEEKIGNLLDEACLRLSRIYKLQDSFIMKYINNNLNMYLISKITENLVGRNVYNSEHQEPILTNHSLEQTLESIDAYTSASVVQQMSLALGRGVAFFENLVGTTNALSHANQFVVEDRTYSYIENPLAIDHRKHLVEQVQTANDRGINLSMCAILDDTSETVFDLLWMQQLLKRNKHFRINLLLNRAQVSINFSSNMLKRILSDRHFRGLASRLNTQLFVFETFCPLISFQTNILTKAAWRVISNSDFVYVKGLNFFETCQIKEKDTYHAFVVYGPVSRLYTDLIDFDAVFAYVPKGREGYVHNRDHTRVVTLSDVCSMKEDLLATTSRKRRKCYEIPQRDSSTH